MRPSSLVILCVSAILQNCLGSQHSDVKRADGQGDYLLVCKQEPIELGIVLDSSSSIYILDFLKAKKFLQNFLQQFQIGTGRNDVRVSIIPYGWGIYRHQSFNLDTYTTKDEVLEAVGRIRHMSGLRTDTGAAIKYMHQVQMAPDVTRSWAEKVSIVITDGNSQNATFTRDTASAARADGITMIAVGVGKVRQKELVNIAGEEGRVTRVASYGQLESIKELLAKKACVKKRRPTTTVPPRSEEMCGRAHPSDINFVFSPADLGYAATAWVSDLYSRMVSQHHFGQGFRFGAVTGSCPELKGRPLGEFTDLDDFRNHVADYDRYRLPDLLYKAAWEGYGQSYGGREAAQNVAVVVLNGEELEGTLEEDIAAVQQMLASDVKVFLVDPYDSGVEIPGAVTLRGQGSRIIEEQLVNNLCHWD